MGNRSCARVSAPIGSIDHLVESWTFSLLADTMRVSGYAVQLAILKILLKKVSNFVTRDT